MVVFAHGSGSGRASPRGRSVAAMLHGAGFATLLFDLLTPEEARSEQERALTFDIGLLAGRLGEAVGWVRTEYADSFGAAAAPVGLFGASTGAAAALSVAARRPGDVAAVVSRGGRPDLAAGALGSVRAPTLLIVGGADREVAVLNERAARELGCHNRLAVVPGAGHLFAEPGALHEVARLTTDWYRRHLSSGP
ncbi:MAG: hydrolase [Streptosporangiales bacterium]|nr:hydrolase [Streptosporangiales bacterium]